jgi:ATP-dependent DNA helicase RecG
MDRNELEAMLACGEDSKHQFKENIQNSDGLAAEMVAFSNALGGIIFIGVMDDGQIKGLDRQEVSRLNQLISNTASQHVRSPIAVQTENIGMGEGKVVIALNIPEGIDKPYFDRQGVIWLKSGADKRRVNSKEELRRLFQTVDLLHADEVPTAVGIKDLDKVRFQDFLQKAYQTELPMNEKDLRRLLENMNLALDDRLNLAGLLLFGKNPHLIKPVFIIKAAVYPGDRIAVSEYSDSEDFEGTIPSQFEGALSFVMRNLRKVQAGQSVNSLGIPEVPRVVFEELLVNALVHRDYFISAPIRLFIFEDRVEIISPGSLPNNLSVEKIIAGNSNIRNPVLASFVAKGLLPYRGLGTGIRRALEDWPKIQFCDNREGNLFQVTIQRSQ